MVKFLPMRCYASVPRGTSHGPVFDSLFVTSLYCIETAEMIELVFGHRGYPRLVIHCFLRKFS